MILTIQITVDLEFHEQSIFTDNADATAAKAKGSAANLRTSEGGSWTSSEYERLLCHGSTSAGRIREVLNVLAGINGRRVLTSQLASLTGIKDTEIRAALGWLTKFMKANVTPQRWPLAWAYGRDLDSENPFEFHYHLSADQRESWLKAVAAHGQDIEVAAHQAKENA